MSMSEQPQSPHAPDAPKKQHVVRMGDQFQWKRLATAVIACAVLLSLVSADACL